MYFLDYGTILGKCTLISSVFHEVATERIWFSFEFDRIERWVEFISTERRYTGRIREIRIIDFEPNVVSESDISELCRVIELDSKKAFSLMSGLKCCTVSGTVNDEFKLVTKPKQVQLALTRSIAWCENLQTLSIINYSIDSNFVAFISQCKKLSSLTLFRNQLSSIEFPDVSTLTSLTDLTINYNSINRDAFDFYRLCNLKSLELVSESISDKAAVCISSVSCLTNLVLDCCYLSMDAIRSISNLPALTLLSMATVAVGDEGVKYISSLSTLTVLDLSCCELTEKGAESVSKLKNLTELDIGYNAIRDYGAYHISKLNHLTNATLDSCGITDEGAKSLSSLKKLVSLSVEFNSMTDSGIEHLSELSNLKYLWIVGNPFFASSSFHVIEEKLNLKNIDQLKCSSKRIFD